MASKIPNTKTPAPKLSGRPGALTEKIGLSVSKATMKRLAAYQREHGIESRADAVRAALREVGL